MKERPILFSAPMVRALLEGRKTQTRRVMKPRPPGDLMHVVRLTSRAFFRFYGDDHSAFAYDCPYGQPGDRLWVRETFYCDDFRYPDGPKDELRERLEYRADHRCANWEAGCPCRDDQGRGGWRPSIHMPRWASRITLEVTDVRVERLQDISEEDAKAEGAEFHDGREVGHSGWRHDCHHGFVYATAREGFAALWDSINGPDSWKANPWVWAITFSRRTEDKP